MRVTFKKIDIYNFMAFQNESFDFQDHNGLSLIGGKNNDIPGSKNGCGKSLLFSALCYGLFGELPNKIKNEYVHNRYSDDKEVRVSVLFDIEDRHFRVVSGFDKKSRSYCELYSIVNGEETNITKSTLDETYKFIEKEVLNFDMSIFLRTILLTTDNQYNFFRLKKAEKKEFIEKLFDISIFGDMYDLIHKDILSYDKKILAIQNRLIVLENNQDTYLKQVEEHTTTNKRKISELEDILAQKKDELSKVNDVQIKEYNDKVEELNKQIRKTKSCILGITTEIDRYNERLRDNDRKTTSVKQQFNSTKQQISKHKDLYSKLCNDCKGLFSTYYNFDSIKNELVKLKEKYDYHTKQNELFERDKSNLQAELNEHNEKLNELQTKLRALNDEYMDVISNATRIRSDVNHYEHEIERLKTSTNPYIGLMKKNMSELETNKTELGSISETYKYLKFSESIVSQDTLKKFIIKDLIHLLNNKIQFYLNRLGSNYTCVFDENMDYVFTTTSGKCEYDSFSSGERMRLNIATSFAFRDFMATRSNIMSNILILDEYMDSNIDSIAIEGILGILRDYNRIYKQNVYIISHRMEIQSTVEIDNIIQIEKTNGVSKINYLT